MIYALKERIGDPVLFCGRRRQMDLLLKWMGMIPREMAKSRALLGRRKSGKSAIMQRLFNILWDADGKVVPFYFEVNDCRQWLLDFVKLYYRSFLTQYFSFKNRTILAGDNRPHDFNTLIDMAEKSGDGFALKDINAFREYLRSEDAAQAMNWAFSAPGVFAREKNIFVLVMIDEIQYMTKYIYQDKAFKVLADRLPGAYHGLVESKIAPMLVSGSYVGWMVRMMREMFAGGRLKRTPIPSQLTFEEGLEAVYRYAEFNRVELTDESALAINRLTQSDPFYIACLMRSDVPDADFRTVDGVVETLSHEIRDREGELFGTWSEYIYSTIQDVNDQHAKKILLFLSKERYKECTRDEISDHLGGELSDGELEEKLRALEYGDLITHGSTNFRYCGIPDDILDLIFRDLYQEEIDRDRPDISKELAEKIAALEKDKRSLRGAVNELKGRMLELMVYRELNKYRKKNEPVENFKLRFRAFDNGNLEKILTLASKSPFTMIWFNHHLQLPQSTPAELDVLALGEDSTSIYALIFEVKNRDEKHAPSAKEAYEFVAKMEMLKEWLAQKEKKIKFVCPVYLSAKGFIPEIERLLHENGVLTADLGFLQV